EGAHVISAEAPTLVYTKEGAPGEKVTRLKRLGVEVSEMPSVAGRLSLDAVLDDLGRRGIASLFVEGGAAVLTSFLAAGLVDRAVVVTAPFLLGAGIEA